ncbi:MAG: alanine:cation symporter family protein [Nitrospira sp. SB0662_bin_26]|nr:alanine:cation symporter family protein [Nitrospira sp. SB0662_bin_26]
MNLDQQIDEAISPIASVISEVIFFSVHVAGLDVPVIAFWLITAGLVFSLYFRFPNIRYFGLALKIVRGQYTRADEPGDLTHFQALSAALSGTVGVGNIAGVAVAISIGGPGAMFWMMLAGILGMATKMVECTLGVAYRRINADGTVSGGPMHYIHKGLTERGFTRLGPVLATLFSIFGIGASITLFQVNQAFTQFSEATGFHDGLTFGIVTAFAVGLVIIAGVRVIGVVAQALVPLMAFVYLAAGFIILCLHVEQVPAAFVSIVVGAFAPEGVSGGVIGAMIIGLQRAVYSNEAGIGSASIAHSAVKTREPSSEGLVALLEPFIDTIVVSTMTALIVIVTGAYKIPGLSGIEITSAAYASVFPWFPNVLAVAVILFVYTTMLTWSYYSVKCWTYLAGESYWVELGYKVVYCLLLSTGAVVSMNATIEFADSMFFAMAIPNVIALYILGPQVKSEIEGYVARIRSGKIRRVADDAANAD